MRRKIVATTTFALVITLISIIPIISIPVLAWENGDSSDIYYGVRFGSHDWIADHAMNMLPANNRTWYTGKYRTYFLTGTEAPDNSGIDLGGGLTGYGDKVLHHNYYLPDHSGTNASEDDASVRCQEEYTKVVNALSAENYLGAVFWAGAMTHYLADLGVWGHVMGTGHQHPTEQHHSDYEGTANTRMDEPTEDYFRVSFDGIYNQTISAYQASYEMGLDTDSNGTDGLTPGEPYDCQWLDDNYHAFSVPPYNPNDDFERRCEYLINLAVNLLADLLYQLFSNADIPEIPPDDPPFIPGFETIFVFGAIALVSLFWVWKNKKKRD